MLSPPRQYLFANPHLNLTRGAVIIRNGKFVMIIRLIIGRGLYIYRLLH